MTQRLTPLYLPCLKGQIGTWAFYSTIMKFSEVAERISLSDEIYKNKRLSDMIQRSVSKRRATQIAHYLRNEPERFFPAMVVAVFEGKPNWLEFSITNRGADPEFDISSLDISKLYALGFLSLSGDERLFPLDGQHRLAGIREALRREEMEDGFLGDDEVTVTLVAHEPSENGRTRSRRLFTTLNKRAVSVKKHDRIALDEDDVMAIATRHLVERFPPFAKEGIISFRPVANISVDNKQEFTTIITLYDILSILLRAISNRSTKTLEFNRPDEEWLHVYLECSQFFFSMMIDTFPEVKQCLIGDGSSEAISRNRRDDGGHILFRPVGQKLLAQLVAAFSKTVWTDKFESTSISTESARVFATRTIKNAYRKFEQMPTELSERPYNGLIWDSITRTMQVRRASLLRDVILKQYGLLQPSIDRGLDKRLKDSLGDEYSLSNFVW